MPRLRTSAAFILVSGLSALADTHTPFPAGTAVRVTTTTGDVTGVLRDSPNPDWLHLTEPGRSDFTAVRLGSVSVVRPAAPGVVGAVPATPAVQPAEQPAAAVARAPTAPRAPAGPRDRPAAATEGFDLPFVFGMPRTTDTRHAFTPPGQPGPVAGITILERTGFTIGHYDRFKVPAWVAMRWSEEDLELSRTPFRRPPFRPDTELPPFARAGTNYEFATSRFERGHMARDLDLGAWGQEGVEDGARMSNIVPQRQGRNHVVWGRFENEHREVVGRPSPGMEVVWIVSGPVFLDNAPLRTVGNEVGVPHATYKVLGWMTRESEFRVRGIMIAQDARDVADLDQYLVPVDSIEAATGLDFFHELPDAAETALEAARPSRLWFDN